MGIEKIHPDVQTTSLAAVRMWRDHLAEVAAWLSEIDDGELTIRVQVDRAEYAIDSIADLPAIGVRQVDSITMTCKSRKAAVRLSKQINFIVAVDPDFKVRAIVEQIVQFAKKTPAVQALFLVNQDFRRYHLYPGIFGCAD